MYKHVECRGADKPFANIPETTLAKNVSLTGPGDKGERFRGCAVRLQGGQGERHRQSVHARIERFLISASRGKFDVRCSPDGLNPVLLRFEDRNLESQFQNQPDPQFQQCVIG
ncbi:hypothetical protein MRX96_027400 [Rhipicephalus microplus]